MLIPSLGDSAPNKATIRPEVFTSFQTDEHWVIWVRIEMTGMRYWIFLTFLQKDLSSLGSPLVMTCLLGIQLAGSTWQHHNPRPRL